MLSTFPQNFRWVSGGRGLEGLQAEYARIALADTSASVIPNAVPSELVYFCQILLRFIYKTTNRLSDQPSECFAEHSSYDRKAYFNTPDLMSNTSEFFTTTQSGIVASQRARFSPTAV